MGRDECIEVERAGWRALCEGTAAAFYERTMLPGGRMVMADGSVLSRAEVVQALRDAPVWDSFALDELRTVDVADDVVALVYVATARRGDAAPFVAAMSSVYARTAEGWKLALYQQTERR